MKLYEDMTKEEFDVLKALDTRKFEYAGMELLGKAGVEPKDMSDSVISLAVLSYFIKKYDIGSEGELHVFLDENIEDMEVNRPLQEFVAAHWKEIQEFSYVPLQKELKALVLFSNSSDRGVRKDTEYDTPDSVAELAMAILDIRGGDNVLDMCSGRGNFLVKSSIENHEDCAYHGIEINPSAVIISKIKSLLLGNKFTVEKQDILQMDSLENKYDKVFSEPPYGAMFEGKVSSAYTDELSKYIPKGLTKKADFLYMILPMLHQKCGGKTVVLATHGTLFRMGREAAIRENLIKSGKVEAIITLPQMLLSYTSIPLVAWVFSDNNSSVRVVDASELGQEVGRKSIALSADDIKRIMEALKQDSDISKSVSMEELAKNEYVLMPKRYLNTIKIENGVKLIDLMKKQGRGMNIASPDLSEQDTGNGRYLMLQNISDGTVNVNLPYLVDTPKQYSKYTVQEGDLLVSRTTPFKIAIMPKVEEDVIASGNLYVITLDSEKVNPFYVMLYLNSKLGLQQLMMKCTTGILANIAKADLESVKIPMIPRSEQDELVEKYSKVLGELQEAEAKVNNLRNMIGSVLD